MLTKQQLLDLSNHPAIAELNVLKQRIDGLNMPASELLDLTQEIYSIGSKAHLNSLNPLVREELGIQLTFQTRGNPEKQAEYKQKKNTYLSIGKSYAAVSFLFDLVHSRFTDLDILLMHELLINDGQYRTDEASVDQSATEKKIFPAGNIQQRVEELVSWYKNFSFAAQGISPVVLAAVFHYELVAIHPFADGNGRLARIFLNLILLQGGYFPVIIPDAARPDYYQTLIEADKGNFVPLIELIAGTVKNKLADYLRLTEELSNLRYNTTCLVLTEDGNTTMMQNLLGFSGFDMDSTIVESYDGKDNIAAAAFLARKTKDKRPNLKHIIFHRDRDNYLPQQLNQVITKLVKNNGLDTLSTIFITEGYDMESYFLDPRHVNALCPAIDVTRASQLIDQATVDCSEVSKKKLRIALAGTPKYERMADPKEIAEMADQAYDQSPYNFRYGKAVLRRLEELVTAELGLPNQVSLVEASAFINVRELKSALQKLNS